MHRLINIQLRKAFGNGFNINDSSDELKEFVKLVNQAYEDFYVERSMLEHTLAVSSEELTQANRDIMRSNELLSSVRESISDAIFYKDLDFRYIGCNRHFALLTAFPMDAIAGKDDRELFGEEAVSMCYGDEALLKEGRHIEYKKWIEDVGGRDRYLSIFKSPLLNAKGETIGIVGTVRDITQQYAMEQELESRKVLLIQQGRLASMGEMIGNIAHQWRQPLNALGLIVQKLKFYQQRGVLDSEKLDESVNKSMDIIDSMSSTIDDFREFFNPNKRQESFSVNDVIGKAFSIVEASFHSKMIGFNNELSEPPLEVYGYKNEFAQVIVNLLNNAKEALIEEEVSPAFVEVRVSQAGANRIEISVEDNAGGIPEAILPKIFDPYFTTKEEGKGTGIGLYMSKMIIEDHMNGRLSASNTEKGALLKISLPLQAAD